VFTLTHRTVIRLMVVSEQMEHAVDEKQGVFIVRTVSEFFGFAPDMIVGDDHRPQRQVCMITNEGKTEHIGGGIELAVFPVELGNGRIIANHELDIALGQCIGNRFKQSKIQGLVVWIFKKYHAEVYPNTGKIMNENMVYWLLVYWLLVDSLCQSLNCLGVE